MQYIDLVNILVREGAEDQDQLTIDTWDSYDATRSFYPRAKRMVSEAWKKIQMGRTEWEFNNVEISSIVFPRLRVTDGSRTAGEPAPGTIFLDSSDNTEFQFTVKSITTTTGDWTAGTAQATIEFETYTGVTLHPGDTFTEAGLGTDGTFTYLGRGAYNFLDVNPYIDEINWTTFTGVQVADPPISASNRPIRYIPWDNWFYNQFDFTNSSMTVPQYVSQDYKGEVVFYPQTFAPFRIDFIASTTPQILTDPDDVPYNLKSEYHDWIAWEALSLIAFYDKNPDLKAYADSQADFYKRRANANLLPKMSWAQSAFDSSGRV